MKTAVLSLLFICCLCLIALPAVAEQMADQAPAADQAQPAVQDAAPVAQPVPPITAFPVQPIFQTCTVTIQCADGSSVSCQDPNNSCSTSSNGRCVICGGVQGDCCAQTCCEVCDDNYNQCELGCDPQIPVTCRICDRVYDKCVQSCGGCY